MLEIEVNTLPIEQITAIFEKKRVVGNGAPHAPMFSD